MIQFTNIFMTYPSGNKALQNINLNIDNIVGDLNTSEWQIIEICKALSKNPKFIIMDEPTASLDESQIENLSF